MSEIILPNQSIPPGDDEINLFDLTTLACITYVKFELVDKPAPSGGHSVNFGSVAYWGALASPVELDSSNTKEHRQGGCCWSKAASNTEPLPTMNSTAKAVRVKITVIGNIDDCDANDDPAPCSSSTP